MPANVRLITPSTSFSSMPIPATEARDVSRRKVRPARHVYARFEREMLFRRMTRAASVVGVIALWVFAGYLTMLLRHV